MLYSTPMNENAGEIFFFWVWNKPSQASDLHRELSSIHGSMRSHQCLMLSMADKKVPNFFPISCAVFCCLVTLWSLACSFLKDCFNKCPVSSENTAPRDAVRFFSKLLLSETSCCWERPIIYCYCRFSTSACYKTRF